MNMKNAFRVGNRAVFRPLSIVVLGVALCASLVTPLLNSATVLAQDDGVNRSIAVGGIATATLDSDNYLQTFRLFASEGDVITVDVTTEVEALAPVVVVIDEQGAPVAQDNDVSTPAFASIADINIPANGTYYIVVSRGSGAEGDASGEFTLQLSGLQQVGGQTVTLENGGIVFDLTWNAAVNLNLEVRDPVGGTVHAFNPGSPSGGTLDADINATCETAVSDQPTETIAWPRSEVPAGSYEVIIYYVDACQIGGPQVFTLNANVNDEEAQSLTGTVNPGQQYLARMVLEPSGAWTLVNGGVNAGLDVSLFQSQIADATPIAVGTTVTGTITNSAPAQVYSFEATSGMTVSIDMPALNGSLDSYLVLLGPDNTPLVSNDDRDEATADAGIDRNLTVDGTYTIIATRYGLTIGGTEGDFNLVVTAVEPTSDATGTDTTGDVTGTETGATADLPQGAIEVTLSWLTNADMQLLIRDPAGDSIFDDLPESRSGGILAADGNVGCIEPTTTPVSYIYWPPNRLLPGVYEIEVWYQNNCDDTTPVNFALTVDVQEQTVINTTQPINVDDRYMITFTVGTDGTTVAGPGGFFDMTNATSLNYQSRLDTATPITYGQIVSGSITDQQRYQLYAFEGQQGDLVTIGMELTGGTLDTALYLISPEGIQLAYNDDVTAGDNTNSVIEQATLASTGTYYIIATHYGLNVGGTQGTYNLELIQE